MTNTEPTQCAYFYVGEIRVTPPHNTLSARGQSVQVQPKVMAVLHYLALHQERVIDNDELIEKLWQGRIVTHGSVQKSMNALRGAIAELIDDKEAIVHYSKRGYQLKLGAEFPDTDDAGSKEESLASTTTLNKFRRARGRTFLFSALAFLLVAVLAAVYFINTKTSVQQKVHAEGNQKTQFTSVRGYTNDTGHERFAAPHPNNTHVAYIRESLEGSNQWDTKSQIKIRDERGNDWQLATSFGYWDALEWSPEGNSLVAIEVKREEGLPLSPDYFQAPNYLYSLHVFSLDIDNNNLIEKNLLSQWQGNIESVSWWDENTLEFLAKQGSSAENQRFRYVISEQQLYMLEPLENLLKPISSAIFNKTTAIANLKRKQVQVHFLDEKQNEIANYSLPMRDAKLSWTPDGSAVLAYSNKPRKLMLLYTNGHTINIPISQAIDRYIARPRYTNNGESILYTEEQLSFDIELQSIDGRTKRMTENNNYNFSASYSPLGDKIVYASVRNNQVQLWLIENGREKQLTQSPISINLPSLRWSRNGKHLSFKSNDSIVEYNFETDSEIVIAEDASNSDPLAYYPDEQQLLVLRTMGSANNIWRIKLSDNSEKPLTFGSVGSAVQQAQTIYFQYTGKKGLWALNNKDDSITLIDANVQANLKLLSADENNIYYVSGGPCRESNINRYDISSGLSTTFIERQTSALITNSFNPNKGALQVECRLSESNIIAIE